MIDVICRIKLPLGIDSSQAHSLISVKPKIPFDFRQIDSSSLVFLFSPTLLEEDSLTFFFSDTVSFKNGERFDFPFSKRLYIKKTNGNKRYLDQLVSYFDPRDGYVDYDLGYNSTGLVNSIIKTVFKYPVTTATLNSSFRITPQTSGHFECSEPFTDTVIFIPDSFLQYSTTYRIEYDSTLQFKDGSHLRNSIGWCFTTFDFGSKENVDRYGGTLFRSIERLDSSNTLQLHFYTSVDTFCLKKSLTFSPNRLKPEITFDSTFRQMNIHYRERVTKEDSVMIYFDTTFCDVRGTHLERPTNIRVYPPIGKK